MSIDLTPVTAGDIGVTRTVTLGGVDNLAAAVSARCNLERDNRDDTTRAELDVTINASESTATIEMGTDPTDWLPAVPAHGAWYGQIEVTFASGDVLTWPTASRNKGRFVLAVHRQIDP